VDSIERGDGGGEKDGDFTHHFNDKHMCPQRKYALWQEKQLTYMLNNQAFLIISWTMAIRKICDVVTLVIIHEKLTKLGYRSKTKGRKFEESYKILTTC
jgi:hypothetical protein